MAWKGTCPVGERQQLVQLVREGIAVVDVAAMFGVSRKTAYKWLERADRQGDEGLGDLSRARHHIERFEGPAIEMLLALRRKHPNWGARKLLEILERRNPRLELPAASTAGELLKRAGLVSPRRKRAPRGVAPYQVGRTQPVEPNDRWTVDFKGEFRLGDGALCFPLTLRDAVSRKMLDIHALRSTRGDAVKLRYEWAFREYGLPLEMHSDTGKPFGSPGLARLSRLNVYLLKLGIRPVFSRPGKPQDNGGHERMHRDLKAETTRPAAHSMSAQQRRFESFKRCFNDERPHEALAGEVPAAIWTPSLRQYPSKLREPEYPAHWETRRANQHGHILWKSERVVVTSALRGERVGIEPVDDGLWRVHFAALCLGVLNEHTSPRKVLGVRPNAAAQLPPTEKAS
jgi:transposase InsO family protein